VSDFEVHPVGTVDRLRADCDEWKKAYEEALEIAREKALDVMRLSAEIAEAEREIERLRGGEIFKQQAAELTKLRAALAAAERFKDGLAWEQRRHTETLARLEATEREREALLGLLREAHDVCTWRVREPTVVARIAHRIEAKLERQP
jgi:hypothetical protein